MALGGERWSREWVKKEELVKTALLIGMVSWSWWRAGFLFPADFEILIFSSYSQLWVLTWNLFPLSSDTFSLLQVFVWKYESCHFHHLLLGSLA